MLARGAVAALLLALLAAVPAPAGAAGGLLAGRVGKLALPYRLPANARQGQPIWYLVHLHARARFAPDDRGEYILSAATGTYSAAQIVLRVGGGIVVVDSLGLVDGRRIVRHRGSEVTVDFRNYAQLQGIRGGPGVLNVQLETVAGLGVRGIDVLPDTGLEQTRVLPDELRLQAPRNVVAGRVGDTLSIPFRLDRRGGRRDLPVRVVLGVNGPGLVPDGGVVRRFARLGTERAGAFSLRAQTAGAYLVSLRVPQRYNQPGAVVRVSIAPRPTRGVNWPVVAGLAAIAAVAAGWLLRRRFRR